MNLTYEASGTQHFPIFAFVLHGIEYPAVDQNSGPEISSHLAGSRNKHIYSSVDGRLLPALKAGQTQGIKSFSLDYL